MSYFPFQISFLLFAQRMCCVWLFHPLLPFEDWHFARSQAQAAGQFSAECMFCGLSPALQELLLSTFWIILINECHFFPP